MDVSTDICNDSKFRRLHRHNPDHVAPAFFAYVAVLSESWKAGRRVTVADSWPTVLPFDAGVVASMVAVGLLDKNGRPPAKVWSGWYEPARRRRDQSRDRWNRYNEKRNSNPVVDGETTRADTAFREGGTTVVPRGNDVATATSVPFLPSVPSGPTGPSVPTVERARRAEKNDEVKPDTEEERRLALLQASEEFRAGRITEMEYARLRKDLAS
jgi:hypothetical protein